MFKKYIFACANKIPFSKSNIFKNFCSQKNNLKETINIFRVFKYVQRHVKIRNWKSDLMKIVLVASVLHEVDPAGDVKNNLDYLLAKAVDEIIDGNYEQAEEILTFTSEIAKKYDLRIQWEFICNKLVNLSIVQGDFKKAETLLIDGLEQLQVWHYPPDSNTIIEFTLRLSQIYSVTGNDALAKIGFNTCLKNQQTKITNQFPDENTGLLYVTILFSYSSHLIKYDMYDEAKEMLDTAEQYLNFIPNLSVSDELMLREVLADLNTDFGNVKLAIDNLISAIALAKLLNSPNISMYQSKLEDIYKNIEE